MVKRSKGFIYGIIITINLCHLQTIMAAEWSIQPGLDFTSIYNDNIWVSSISKNTALDVRLKPKLKTRRVSESSEVSLNTAWLQKKYISDDKGTRGLFSSNLSVKKEFDKQSIFFLADYIERSTTSSETTGFGRALIETIKTEQKIIPTWQLFWSPKLYLDASFYYSNVKFEQSVQQWFDYRNVSPSVSSTYQTSENIQWRLTAGAKQFALMDIDYVVDILFFQTGINLTISDHSQIQLLIGEQQIESKLTSVKLAKNESGFYKKSQQLIVEADYTLDFEKSNINFSVSRNSKPTSQGDVQLIDKIQISENNFWSRDWSTQVSINAENRESVGSNSNFTRIGKKTGIVRLKINWHNGRKWRTYLLYRILFRQYENEDTWVSSNQVMLSTRYTWGKKIL